MKMQKLIGVILIFMFTTSISAYSESETNLASHLVRLAKERNVTITTAESCTGGMISAAITSVPGSSEVFKCGFVTYANEAKMKLLGVQHSTIAKHTEVSKEVAKEMAQGVLQRVGATIAVATTGFAGPGGGTQDNPVGTVYISVATADKNHVMKYYFEGDRDTVRELATHKALELLIHEIKAG